MKKTTIWDVATMAGVSISTVSRYLNGNDCINPETQVRIHNAIRQLNYTLNAAARSLKSRRTHVIGTVMPDIGNPFFISVCKALDDFLTKFGYSQIICNSYEDQQTEYTHIRALIEHRVDALVLCSTGKNLDLIDRINKEGTPIVLVDRCYDHLNMDSVVENTDEMCRQLTLHLFSRNITKIICLAGSSTSTTASRRIAGIQSAYAENGVPACDLSIIHNCLDENDVYEAVDKIMKSAQHPEVFFATNPRITNGFILYAVRNKLSIPRDVSFVGFSIQGSRVIFSSDVTCIEQNPSAIGYKVGEILIKQLHKPDNVKRSDPIHAVIPARILYGDTIR